MTYEIGTNLTTLGLLYLGLKFLLPLFIGIGLLVGVYFAFRYFTSGVFPIAVDKNWAIVVVCAVLILLLVIATG
jgi:hypothetical protein